MATTKKISRKELLKPDEFFTTWGQITQFVLEYKQQIILGSAGVLALILLISGGLAYSKNKEIKASNLLSEAQIFLSGSSSPMDPQQNTYSLSSTPEKDMQVLEILEKITDEYNNTQAALIARIIQGQIYYEKEEYDKAQTTYEAFLNDNHDDEELVVLAREGLTYCHEAKGEFDKAVKTYEQLSKSSLPHVCGWALIGKARCHEKLEDIEMALADYNKVLADYPQHPRIKEVKANIARLQKKSAGPQNDNKNIILESNE